MKKPTAQKPANADALAPLIAEVRSLIQSARNAAASTINTLQVMTNYEIGRRIVEHEQKGEKRADYGKELLKRLSEQLAEEFGQGFSVSNLQLMRKFFLENEKQIQQSATVKLASAEISQSPIGKLDEKQIVQSPTGQFKNPFSLSWTHYVVLLTIKDPSERSFYEIEATNEF
jgi:predicted nuclease of restriction endonuclease-like (RecB) superfamily